MQGLKVIVFAALACNALASTNAAMANPIRKVVNLLEGMASKAEKEGEEEKKIYEEYMCHCKTHTAELQKAVDENSVKGPALESQIAEDTAANAKLKEDLTTHKADLATAQAAAEAAQGVRKKEAEAFTAEVTQKKGFVEAINKALPALKQGAAGFLQTNTALSSTLKQATAFDATLTDDDRDTVMSLLSVNAHSADYAPAGGEAVGILQNMLENYQKDVDTMTATENDAAATFQELMSAKGREVTAHKTAIQKKTERSGDLAVAIVEKKADKKQSQAMVDADQAMLDKLRANCKAETPVYDERQKMRSEELIAIAETKKILNDDDALDVFKATLPSGAGALLQLDSRSKLQGRIASAHKAAAILRSQPRVRPELRFLELALMGKKVDMRKVIKLIDGMISLMARELQDDERKKKYCVDGLNDSKIKSKDIAKSVSEQEANKDDRAETMAAVADEIKNTQGEIASLDSLTADATTERKAQNAEFTEFMSSNHAAKEILQFASQRLRKFYQPGSEEEALLAKRASIKKVGHVVTEAEIMAPLDTTALFKTLDYRLPASAKGGHAHSKKVSLLSTRINSESNRVIEMIAHLIDDVSKEMTVAQVDEEHAQSVYEDLMADSSKKRATYGKSMTVRESAKAENEESKNSEEAALSGAYKAMKAQGTFTLQLHKECDWLLQNYDLRRNARADEADSLTKAKAVLRGADFSFVQLHTSRSLRGQK